MIRLFSTLLIFSFANSAMAVLSVPFSENFEGQGGATPYVLNKPTWNNWNVTSGGVDLVADPFTSTGGGPTTNNGAGGVGNGFFVDLVGSGPGVGQPGTMNGGLQSSDFVSLQPGLTYTLSYDFGYAGPSPATGASMELGFRKTGTTTAVSGTSFKSQMASGFMNPNDNQGSLVYTHVGAAVDADIYFVNTAMSVVSNGVLLDDINLTVAAVPEPSAFLFFTLVTMGTGLVRFKSRSDSQES